MIVDGKTCLLTGAAGGLGRELALQISDAGGKLILVGRNAERLSALQAEIEQQGGEARCLVADLSQTEDCQRLAAEPFDILINNAGQSYFGEFSAMPIEQLESMYQTNLLAPLRLIHASLPRLKQRPEAAIVNIGSVFGTLGYGFFSAYSGSKFGLRGFSEALRRELHDSHIQILYAAPRAIDTSINDARVQALNEETKSKVDAPAAVASAILQALESERSEIVLGQPEGFFAHLNQLFPRLIDKALVKNMRAAAKHAKTPA